MNFSQHKARANKLKINDTILGSHLKCIPQVDNKWVIQFQQNSDFSHDITDSMSFNTGHFIHVLHCKHFLTEFLLHNTHL